MPDESPIPEKYYKADFGAQILGCVPFFQIFSEYELGKIYALGELKSFNPHTSIVVEGEPTSGLYVLLEGSAVVTKRLHTGERLVVSQLAEGHCFGELSLVLPSPRCETVTASESLVTYHLDAAVWGNALAGDVEGRARFHEQCLKVLAARLLEREEEVLIGQRQLWEMTFRGMGRKGA